MNKVFLNPDGYIEAHIVGDQTGETFLQSLNESKPLIESVRKQNKPLLGLVDISEKGEFTPSSNKAAMEILSEIDYDRLAIFGADGALKEVAQLIVAAMGKSLNTQLFNNRQAAVDWLMGEWPEL